MLSWQGSLMLCVVLWCLCGSCDGCPNACSDKDVNDIPGCHLRAHACKCIFSSDCEMGIHDPVGNINGNSGWKGSCDSAGRWALVDLFKVDWGCNCMVNESIRINSNCSLKGELCFFFQDVDHLNSKNSSYKVGGSYIVGPRRISRRFEAIAWVPSQLPAAVMGVYQQIVQAYPQCSIQSSGAFGEAINKLHRN